MKGRGNEMKRRLSLFDKCKMFYKWLNGQDGFGLIGSCGLCNSTKLSRLKFIEDGEEYSAIYKCESCGAEAQVSEIWSEN
jgi:hypothetical protein